MKKKFILLFFLTFYIISKAQTSHEFMGIVKLNDSTLISYLLNFKESKGKITGYSITDLQGADETKNIIEGTYDKSTKIFSFKENDIEYTKSEYLQQDFCYINFEGKLKLTNKSSSISGKFVGMFNNSEKCIDGEIRLIGSEDLYQKLNSYDKKISKSKKVDSITKSKISFVKILDSLKTNSLKEGENTSVFWNSNRLTMDIWDAGKEDGDIISIYVEGKLILDKFLISHQRERISIDLNKKITEIKIVAENVGEIPPNTANIILFDKNKEIDLFTDLHHKKSTVISVIKK